MVTSKRVARFANDFGWQLFEAEPERYTREELFDLWEHFARSRARLPEVSAVCSTGFRSGMS